MQSTTTLNNASDKDNTLRESPHFFLLSPSELEERFDTSAATGVAEADVVPRQTRDGLNELSGGGGGVSILGILGGQLFNAMVLVLIMAFAVCLGIRSWIEGCVSRLCMAKGKNGQQADFVLFRKPQRSHRRWVSACTPRKYEI